MANFLRAVISIAVLELALVAQSTPQSVKTPETIPPPGGCTWFFEPPQMESLYAFTKVQIRALSLAHAGAEAAIRGLAEKEGHPIHQMTSRFTGLRENQKANNCAAFLLSHYTASKNEMISMVASFLILSYQELARQSEQTLQILQRTARGVDPVSISDQLSHLKVKRQETIGDLINAVGTSLMLLIDPSRTSAEGTVDHMILSQSQRDDLLKYLRSEFPELDDENKVKQSDDFVKVVSLIRSFLVGKYKPSDK